MHLNLKNYNNLIFFGPQNILVYQIIFMLSAIFILLAIFLVLELST